MDKIICIGKNYIEHARELGDAVPSSPVLFLKPPSTAVYCKQSGDVVSINLPQGRGIIHPECEIVLRMNSEEVFDAVTLGLDMTLRDIQTDLKKKGHPWEVAKVFQHATVIGPWIDLSNFKEYLDTPFSFSVDGKTHQTGLGREMRFSPTECFTHIQKHFPICPGDCLFTGTPAGVTAVSPGQSAELKWGHRLSFQVHFV
jgi:2-keto-4-pentenoate hydratase/2-oxohepta-3-ene-1,7-dioic acid hydratase in catechol pathway